MQAYENTVMVIPELVKGKEVTTEGGIIIKQDRTGREGNNVFLAFGKVVSSAIPEIKAGDRVGYNPYDSFEFEFQDEVYEAVKKEGIRIVDKQKQSTPKSK